MVSTKEKHNPWSTHRQTIWNLMYTEESITVNMHTEEQCKPLCAHRRKV